MSGLTDRQQRFVEEYLVDLNAKQAAIRAGYSERSAEVEGSRLLSNAKVAEAVQKAMKARSERTAVTADRIVAELARMAFYDPADIAGQVVNQPSDIATLPEDVRRAIVGWSWDKHGNFVLKLSPKTPSLEMLGRHLGMFKDKVEHTGKDGGPIQIVISPDDAAL